MGLSVMGINNNVYNVTLWGQYACGELGAGLQLGLIGLMHRTNGQSDPSPFVHSLARYAWLPAFRCRSAVGGQPISVLVTSSLCIRKDVSSNSVLTRNGNGSYGTEERQRHNGNGRTATECWKLGISQMVQCNGCVHNQRSVRFDQSERNTPRSFNQIQICSDASEKNLTARVT